MLPFELALFPCSFFIVAVCQEQVLRIGITHNGAKVLDFLHTLPKTFLEAVAESLTGLPAAGELDGELLSTGGLALWVRGSVPGCYGQGKHVALAVQALDPANGAQW